MMNYSQNKQIFDCNHDKNDNKKTTMTTVIL